MASAAALSGACSCQSLVASARLSRRPETRSAATISLQRDSSKVVSSRAPKQQRVFTTSFLGNSDALWTKSLKKSSLKGRGSALQTQAVSQETASVWTAVYGLLLLGGGTSAYLKSGSKQSVISGAVGAALSAVAYYLESQESTHQTGLAVAFGYSLLFASVFGIRLFATKKPFPAAPLLALSLASAFVFASAYNSVFSPLT